MTQFLFTFKNIFFFIKKYNEYSKLQKYRIFCLKINFNQKKNDKYKLKI